MLKGMTGFGSASISLGAIKILVEMKSINHRYCDISCYLPTGFIACEEKIRQVIKKDINRGRVTVSIKITEKPNSTVVLNKDVVKQYFKSAKVLSKEFHLKNDIALSDVLTLPGVFETREVFIQPTQVWGALEKGINKAVNGLVNMRKREGKSLIVDISSQLKKMTAEVKKIESRTKTLLTAKKKTLNSEEFSSVQKNMDINEELARLKHYIQETKTLLKSVSSSGKKIDFIGQEMQRETNTIGSKVQDVTVSSAVISLKSKVEKIREQAQNIE